MQAILARAAAQCEALGHAFPPESQTALLGAVHSVEELLAMNDDKFTVLTGGLSIDVYLCIVETLVDTYPVLTQSPLSMIAQSALSLGCLSFGPHASKLDQLCHGGVWTDEVTEIVAPSAAGKTQLSLQLTGMAAALSHCHCLYIDTSLSFNADRLIEMHRHWQSSLPQSLSMSSQSMLARIECQSVSDIFDLFALLERTRLAMIEQHTRYARELRLVIIDSVAAILSPIIGSSSGHGHALMNQLSLTLKSLARRFHLAVVVTNQTVANRSDNYSRASEIKPALGEYWSHIPDTRLILREDSDSVSASGGVNAGSVSDRKERKGAMRKTITVKLDKSSKFASGASVRCEIRSKGVADASTDTNRY